MEKELTAEDLAKKIGGEVVWAGRNVWVIVKDGKMIVLTPTGEKLGEYTAPIPDKRGEVS